MQLMENKDADKELFFKLNEQVDLIRKNELRQQLIDYVNDLLLHDFSKLVQLLYRIDVSEQKLKTLLSENPQTDAAVIITDLIIKRQKEKLETKRSFRPDDDIPEEDKW